MTITNLTTFDNILKDVYLGPIRDQINSKDTVYGMLNKKDQFDGRQLIVPIRKGRSFSFGFQAPGVAVPAAQSQQYDDLRVHPQYYYGTVEITKEVIEQSRTSRGAFARAVRTQLEGLPLDMRDDLDRIVLGNGSGAIGNYLFANTNAGANTVQLATATDARKFGVNQKIQAWDAEGAAAGGALDWLAATTTATVSNVAISAGVTTLTVSENMAATGNPDVTDTDGWLTKNGARTQTKRYEMMGLKGIIDDANPPLDHPSQAGTGLQEIDRSAAGNLFWQSYVNDNSGNGNRALTNGILQSLIDGAKIRGNGAIHYFVVPYGVRFEYAELQLNVRRNVNTARIAGQTTGGFIENEEGYDFIEYNGIGFIPDKYAPANTVMAVDWDSVWVARFADFNWLDDDGSILKWSPNRTPSFEAILYFYGELVTNAPNRCAKAEEIDGDDPVV